MEQIKIQVDIKAPILKVWECFVEPKHITKWNFADVGWYCPFAENDLKIGGKYLAKTEN